MLNKRHITLLFAIFSLSISLYSQTNKREIFIGGVLRASFDNKPIPFATVVVRDSINELLENVSSDQNGRFFLSLESDRASYYLEVSIVGYNRFNTVITVKEGKRYYNLGIITLSENSNLNPVIVTAPQLIKATPDGYIYDVSADPTAKAKKIVHLLEKLPFIELDHNNKPVYFGGSQKIAYLLNGKSSILLNNTSLVMRLISGENIKSIELVPNPPAQYKYYDAVINIVTKSPLFEGLLMGIENETLFENTVTVNPSLSSALNWDKFSMVITGNLSKSYSRGYFGRVFTIDSISESGDIVPGTNIKSDSKSKSSGKGSGLTLLSSYKFSEKRDLSLGAGFDQKFSDSNTETYYIFESAPEKDYNYSTNNNIRRRNLYGTVTYADGRFREKEFRIDYNFNIVNNSNTNLLRERVTKQYQNNFSSQFNIPVKDRRSILFNVRYENLYNIDEVITGHTDKSSNTQQSVTFGSGYLYRYKKSNFNFNADLKYYDNRGYANNSSSLVKYNSFALIPSFSYSIIPTSRSNLSVGVSKTIRNPNIHELYSFVDDSDPKNIHKGNPDLIPERIISASALYMIQGFKFTTGLTVKYSSSTDAIERVSYIDDGVTINTFGNVANKSDFAVRLTERFQLSRRLDISSSISYVNSSYRNDDHRSLDQYMFSLRTKYKMFRRATLTLSGGISPSSAENLSIQNRRVYYRFNNMLILSGNSKDMKFSYIFTAINIQKINRMEKSLKIYEDYRLFSENELPGLMWSFKFSYSFGKVKRATILTE